MELLLWQWSVGVQWASLAMITVFFLILERSFRLPELRAWVLAWACNLAALGITVLYWNWRPEGVALRAIAGAYLGAKTAFGVLLLAGALRLARRGAGARHRGRVAVGVGLGTLAGLFAGTQPELTRISYPLLGAFFAAAAVLMVRESPSLRWLAAGMGLRAGLFLAVGGASFLTAASSAASSALVDLGRQIQSAHSFVDTGAEWLLALASVLALSDRISGELRQTNRDLLAAQEDLRRLVDRDPLTGLLNRRALPELLRRVQPVGALLLFFDLDDFKELNDRHGHATGDECLKRFAAGLRECFRPGDGIVRYAGDEFLVIAQGLEAPLAQERVDRLRTRLRSGAPEAPEIRFSVGRAELAPGGQPEAALEAADRSMYQAKAARVA